MIFAGSAQPQQAIRGKAGDRFDQFSIEGKQAVGFLGINGAGKTTTMNILTGYLSASDGDVIIDGVDVLTDPLKAKTKIGYLPEQPPVYPDMTVKEYLHFIYDLKR